jgi:hypothetical protein
MTRFRQSCVLIVSLGALLLCLSGASIVGLSQRWLPRAGLPLGYTAVVCAEVQLGPPRLEATIMLPHLRSVSVLFHLPGRCAWLPWLPALPHNLHLQFPP